ncbi:hypothetical protein VNO78_22975 [Psophocarpus tetragonolobus]|uniref:Uncharacterized protein n=1 Tax=Psophocarpus tetragonolobus TaxID=3891 RepID=A0AAN9XD62_PSOTE
MLRGTQCSVAIGLKEFSHVQLAVEELRGAPSKGVVSGLGLHFGANAKARPACNQDSLRGASCEVDESGSGLHFGPKQAMGGKHQIRRQQRENVHEEDVAEAAEKDEMHEIAGGFDQCVSHEPRVMLHEKDVNVRGALIKKGRRKPASTLRGWKQWGRPEFKDGATCEEMSGLSGEARGTEGHRSLCS